MRAPLFAVLAVTAIVIAVVLIVVAGISPRGGAKAAQHEQVVLLINSFELSDCDDAEMIGGMTVTTGDAYQRVSAFIAGRACMVELLQAASLRGFAEGERGQLVLESLPGRREELVIYPEGAGEMSAFEWERIKE